MNDDPNFSWWYRNDPTYDACADCFKEVLEHTHTAPFPSPFNVFVDLYLGFEDNKDDQLR